MLSKWSQNCDNIAALGIHTMRDLIGRTLGHYRITAISDSSILEDCPQMPHHARRGRARMYLASLTKDNLDKQIERSYYL